MSFVSEAIAKCIAERKAGQPACARVLPNGELRIETRILRPPARGGRIEALIVRPDGYVRRKGAWDFWEPDQYWLPDEHREVGGARAFLDAVEACSVSGILAA